MYKLVVRQLVVGCPEIFRWCLDYPIDDGEVLLSDLETAGVLFQGWVLPHHHAMPTPFVRVPGGESHSFALNVDRPDVIEKVLAQDAEDHPLLRCGFRFRLPLPARDVVFGFRVGDRDFDYARLSVEGEMKVLEGLEGWLFLDNDTNQSVQQFTGKLLLDRHGRKGWLAYLDAFSRAAADFGFRHAVLIAPTKEMVLARYYPFIKGKDTPVEQVLGLATGKHQVIHPVAALQAGEERTFRVVDTHWTLYGAMLAVTEVLVTLGLDREQVQEVFARDQYQAREVTGDLGNKFYPRRTAAEKFLTSYNYQKQVVYDNYLPNFGRVILLANREAFIAGKCLIFGSSSCYSALPYFSRIFSELILVHSAGNIDLELLRREAPQYVIAQTNGRFVIYPPQLKFSLNATIAEKMIMLPEKERNEVLRKAEQWLAKSDAVQTRYYHAMLRAAIPERPGADKDGGQGEI